MEFNGTPFSIGTKRLLDCQYGTRCKKPSTPTSCRTYLQGSRKKGCQAHIEITEFILYPEYAVTQTPSKPLSQKQTRKVREEMLRSLQLTLAQSKVVNITQKYYVRLPTEEAHHQCHPTKGAMGLSQRIHPALVCKIQELVSVGITDIVEVQRLL